ncbi:hypothetical protein ACU4GD_14725 [Cupriavidus basilensis]
MTTTSLAADWASTMASKRRPGWSSCNWGWVIPGLASVPTNHGVSAQLGYWLPEQRWRGMPYRLGFDTSIALDRYPVGHDFDARRHDLRCLKGKLPI